MIAVVIGTLIAIAALTFVLWPLLVSGPTAGSGGVDPGSRMCEQCGPRPESDTRFCSRCGRPLV